MLIKDKKSPLEDLYEKQRVPNGQDNAVHLDLINQNAIEKLEKDAEELNRQLFNLAKKEESVNGLASALQHIMYELLTAYTIAHDRVVQNKIEKNTLAKEQLELVKKYQDLKQIADDIQETGTSDFFNMVEKVDDILRAKGEDESAEEFSDSIKKFLQNTDNPEEVMFEEAREHLSLSLDELMEKVNSEVLSEEEIEQQEIQRQLQSQDFTQRQR
jgi:hypothetical protein